MARETTTRRKKTAAEEAPPTEPSAAVAPGRDPSELNERIKRRAYELWEEEGRPSGREEEHWRRAEQEIAAEARGEQPAPSASPGGDEAEAARARTSAKRAGTAAGTGTTTRRRSQTG